jgi:hypothetical protein
MGARMYAFWDATKPVRQATRRLRRNSTPWLRIPFGRPWVFLILAVIVGCSPRVIAETPETTSICRSTLFDSWQSVVDLAEQHCQAQGKHAVFVPSLEQCMNGVLFGETSDFKCA